MAPGLSDFVAETLAFEDAGPPTADWADIRARYDRMAAAFHAGRPAGLPVSDDRIAGVPVRRYGAPAALSVVYAHGGGFILGGLDSHDDICAEIAARTGHEVVSVDYRLVPEHRHPAAYLDVLAVVEALAGEGRVILAGDSAGATLVAAIAALHPRADILGAALIYPLLGSEPRGASFEEHANAPLLSAADLEVYGALRGAEARDPTARPFLADLSRLPPMRLFPSELDPLCSDALCFAEKARAAGAPCSVRVQEGLVHGWLRARHRSAPLTRAWDEIVEAIAALAP